MAPRATITRTPSVSTTSSPPASPRSPRTATTSSSRRSSGRSSSTSNTSSHYPKWHPAVLERTVQYVKHDFEKVVAQSPFLQTAEPAAHIALFSRSEIQTGARLGKGGFSNVYEITGFQLDESISSRLSPHQAEMRLHYQNLVASTKNGKSRFVLKHLQERLLAQPKAFAHAASDLAVEAAYMSSLNHANICKVRGLPIEGLSAIGSSRCDKENRIHDGYFIILDRLQDTLDQRIEQEWKKAAPCSVEEKTRYALQIANALSYLHDRRIVFRDLKPANIGIDINGRIQLFDFGLCRELPAPCALAVTANKSRQQQRDGGGSSSFDYSDNDHHRHHDCDEVYEMSGVGTRRYMAVEIINTRRYNCKADVFGWAMVYYEMLSLEKPFPTYSCQDHQLFVCQNGERPPLQQVYDMNMEDDSCDRHHSPSESLAMIGQVLEQSWCESVCDRYSMKQVRQTLMQILGCYHTRPIVTVDAMPASPVAVNDVCLLCPELEYYDSEDDAQGDGCSSLVTTDFRDDEPTTTQERCEGQEVLLQHNYTSSTLLKPAPPSMPDGDGDHGIPSHLFLPDIQALSLPSPGDDEDFDNENDTNDDAPASVAYRRPMFIEVQHFFSS